MQFKRMTKSTREVLCAFGVSLAPSAERRIQDGPACISRGQGRQRCEGPGGTHTRALSLANSHTNLNTRYQ